jgi:hypothetical protein
MSVPLQDLTQIQKSGRKCNGKELVNLEEIDVIKVFSDKLFC